jgi:hypothetical protein
MDNLSSLGAELLGVVAEDSPRRNMPASAQNSISGAVFLSYAREDIDAARRIADALRSHGVEVWFDENELRGGDAWDAKIRRQINDCTLFVPVISRHTESRG